VRGLVFPSVGASFFYKKKIYSVIHSNLSKKSENIIGIENGTILNVAKKNLRVKIYNSIIILSKIFCKKKNFYVKDLRKIFKKNHLLIGSNV